MSGERLDDAQWAQLETLFADIEDVPPSDRRRWLDRHCPDPAVRRALLRLLAADEKAGEDTAGLRPSTDVVRGWLAQEAEPTTAVREVGPYRLVEEIGHGGSARVFLATRDDLGARVALKLLRYDPLVAPEARRRFEFEHRLLARLEHDHIARLVDAGVTADGTAYLAMEYVEGMPITDYCERNGLHLEARLRLFLQVCDAVGHAHRRGIIHRDLKPGNILVDRRGNAKLLDFGIGKLLDAEEGMPETRTNMRLMTPQYAAPEQLLGEEVTTLSDIYSLGVVLYELLAGRRPFGDADDDPRKLESAVLTGVPRNPSGLVTFAPRRVVRGDLDAVVLRALRREPEGRYAGANAFAADLRRYLSGHPVEARGGAIAYRARKFLWRNRWPAAVATLMLVVAAGYVVREITLRREAEAALATSQEISGFLVSLFSVSDPAQTRGETLTARELLDDGAARVEESLAAQPDVKIRLMQTIGSVYGELGLYADAADLLERALAMARSEYGEEDLRTAEIHARLARLYVFDLSDLDIAQDHGARALETYEAIAGPASLQAAEAAVSLAWALVQQRRAEAGIPLLERALETLRAHLPPDDPVVIDTMTKLGVALEWIGDREPAGRYWTEALDLQIQAHGEVQPRTAELLLTLGWFFFADEDYEGSKAYCERALAINRKLYEGPHSAIGQNLDCISHAEWWLGDLPAALAAAEASEQVLRDAELAHSPILGSVLVHKAHLLHLLGRSEETLPVRREVVQIYRRAQATGGWRLGATLAWLADAAFVSGRAEEAAARYEEALEALAEGVGPDHPRLVPPLSSLAYLRAVSGDGAAALEAVRRAEAVARMGAEPAPAGPLALLELREGEVLAALGRFDEACAATASGLAALEDTERAAHPDHGIGLNTHGYCLALAGETPAEALALMEQGLSLLRQAPRARPVAYLQALERMASASAALGDPAAQARWATTLAQERAGPLAYAAAVRPPSEPEATALASIAHEAAH